MVGTLKRMNPVKRVVRRVVRKVGVGKPSERGALNSALKQYWVFDRALLVEAEKLGFSGFDGFDQLNEMEQHSVMQDYVAEQRRAQDVEKLRGLRLDALTKVNYERALRKGAGEGISRMVFAGVGARRRLAKNKTKGRVLLGKN